jgi:hypothetical protein
MTRIPLPDGHELRVIPRRVQVARGSFGRRESVMISLYSLNAQVGGTISVPVELFDAFAKAIGELRLADIRPPAPEEQGSAGAPPTKRPTP